MTVEELKDEIHALQEYITILELPVLNDKDYILRSYIRTESLAKTKKLISHCRMSNGNKYQLNDIRDLVLNGVADIDNRINDLAYRIYQANKKQSRTRR